MSDYTPGFGGTTGGTEEKLEQVREAAASALESAARTVQQHADKLPGGSDPSGFSRQAAGKLGHAAGYLRTHRAPEILEDARDLLRRYPSQSLIAAAAAGLLIGRALTRRRDSEWTHKKAVPSRMPINGQSRRYSRM